MKLSEINFKDFQGRFVASRIMTVFAFLFIILPVVSGQTADFTASSLTVCEGGDIVFTDASTGITGSVSYAWDFGNGSSPSTAVGSGPHTVTYSQPGTVTVSLTITDESGTSTATKDNYITVNALPSAPVISADGPVTFCEGGSVTLTSSASASYLWSTGATTQSIIVTESGDYSLTVTDANGCTSPVSAVTTVTVNPTPGTPVITPGGPLTFCEGGSVTLTSSASTSYLWSTGATTQSIIVTQSGDYSLTITDGNGCTSPQSAVTTVTVNPLPVPTASSNSPVCEGDLLQLTGGPDGMSSYSWSGPDGFSSNLQSPVVSPSATLVMPGEYTLVVTNSNGCNNSTSTVVEINPLPEASIGGTADVCQGSPSPYITFTGSEGKAPYTFTYRINNGGNQTITTTIGNTVSLAVPTSEVGEYIYELISVRDASSTICQQAQSGSATIVVNPLPSATLTGTADVCREGESPLITFTGSSGTSPYTFTYSINSGDPLTVSTTAGSNSVSLAVPTGNVGSFTYALLGVRDGSSTSCSSPASGTATITVLPLPTATIGGTTTVCRNAASPDVTFTGFSGTPPYTFVYTVNGGEQQSVTATSGNSVTVPVPTSTSGVFEYELVSVSDGSSQSCSNSQEGSAVISVNPLPVAVISGSVTVCQFDSEPAITFTGSEGTAPYTFTYTVNGGSNQTVVSTGSTALVPVPTDLAGVFTFNLVSIRDASSTGCSQPASGDATVTVNNLPTATISGSTEVCQNTISPEVLFTGASGISPYTFTYRINGGTAQTVTTVEGSNTVNVKVPTSIPGTFIYELLNVSEGSASACDQSQTGTATVTVNPLPEASISGSTSVCRDDAPPLVTFTGSGGTSPYTFTYRVNSGGEQTIISTGDIATVAVPTTTTGIYTYELLEVEDASTTSCSQTGTGEVIITINELPSTSAISGDATLFCEATGEVYSVILNPGSSYSWGVPEGATIVSGSTGPDNNSITVNFADNNGNITVIETNSSGCSGAMVSLPVTLQGCNLNPNFTVSSTEVCNGSSVVFTDLSSGISGSTIYNWDFGDGANPSTATGAGPHTVIYTGSGSSSVSLTIEDGATATETKPGYITINPLPTAAIAGNSSVCEDAASPMVTFTGSSGTLPYTFTYTINGGAEQTVQTTSGSSVSVPVPTDTPGSFLYELVSVSDGSSTACEQSVTGSVTVNVNQLPEADITGTTTVCRLDESPLVTFTGSGGTRPYTFSYTINSGGIQTVTTSGSSNSVSIPVSTLTAGTYTYELQSVRDGSSTACEQSASGTAIVTVNPLPTATISGNTEVCRYAESPNVTFTGSGGTPPYTFTYTVNSGTPQTVTTVVGSSVTVPVSTNTAGTFTYSLVSVQDRGTDGCSRIAGGTATITVNQLPTATLSGTASVCEGDPAPSVTFLGANGTEPYTFTYRLNGGNYQTITSSAGNSVSISVPTGEPGTFTYELISVRDASSTACNQEQEGIAVVTVNPAPTASISGTASVCRLSESQGITFTGSNGVPPYTFNYNINSGITLTVTTLAGRNSVTVPVSTDDTGVFTYSLMTVRDASSTACQQSASGSATITVLPLPTGTVSGTVSVCRDDSYPQVTFTGAAGTPPYTFIYNINGGGELSITTSGGNSVSIDVPTETPGVYRYNLTEVIDGSSNSCSNNQSGTAVVTVRELPEATITGGGTLCRNDPQPIVTFTGSSGQAPYTFTYTVNGGSTRSVTTTSGNSIAIQVPTDVAGTFEYELLSVSDAGNPSCGQVQGGAVLYTVNPLPEASISGSTVVCSGDPEPEITFTGSSGTPPYTFTYTINDGTPLTLTTAPGQSSITITRSTAVAGTWVYELVSVQDGSTTGCSQAPVGTAVITVGEIPVAFAGTGGEICGMEFQLGAIPDIGSGVWSMSSGTGTAVFSPDPTDPDAIVTVSEFGLKEFTWTEYVGTCSDDATVEVTFLEIPNTVAGPGGESCDLTFALNAIPDVGTGTWSMTSGTGSVTFIPNANTPDAVVEVTEYGVKEFTWTEVNGNCSNADDLEVIFYRYPDANPGTGGTNCGSVFNLRAIPSYGTGTWSVTSGPGSAVFTPNANSPTASVEIDVYGTYEFTWTEANGLCTDNGTIEVSFIEAVPANGGEGGAECDLDFILNATPVTDNGVWSVLSGPGNVIFDPSPEAPDAMVTVDQAGTYEFGWTETNVVCQSTDIVVVHLHGIPDVKTINDTILCEGTTVELITSGEGSFAWSPSAFLDQTDVRSPTSTPDTTIQYIVTLTDEFGCVNSDTVIVGVVPQPVADAGPDRVLDYIFNTQLQAELRPGETGKWTMIQGGGTFEDDEDPVTMINGLSLGVNLIQWVVTNGACPASTDILSITVNNLVIPTLITPNGDPVNEYFVLRGIETLGVTELVIFDRGGTQVYRSTSYANDWNGVDQNGNPLPEDTYFFVLRPQNGNARSGYIVIRR